MCEEALKAGADAAVSDECEKRCFRLPFLCVFARPAKRDSSAVTVMRIRM
jgi:hypothetical protein